MKRRKGLLVTLLMRERHNARREGRRQLQLAATNPAGADLCLERAMLCAEYSMAAREMIRELTGGVS